MAKIIISCAVTGAIHTPSMSEHLPITPEQIATESIAAAEAGAAIIHLHARNPADGQPTPDPEVFMAFLPRIKQSTDAVVNITTGGGLGMTLDERLAAPLRASPEMCSLNMGSMNFNIAGSAARVKTWKYAWEKPYLENTTNYIFRNTFQDIEQVVERLGKGHGTRFGVRMLRCRPPLQPGAYDGPRRGRGPALRADHLWHSGRHRRPRRATCILCGRQPTGCSATDMSGPCWPRAATRCRSAPWRGSWAAMCGSDWRIRCG